MKMIAALTLLLFSALSARTCYAQRSNATESTWHKSYPSTSFLWSLDSPIPAKPQWVDGLDLSNLPGAVDYGVDLFNSTAEEIAAYKQAGKGVICYFSAGSFEPGRPDEDTFTPACYCNKGDQCKVEGWEEWWLDLFSTRCVRNIQSVMTKRLDMAVEKGCDGVEPDNTDSYLAESRWDTKLKDQYQYLEFLSDAAHQRNLSIALKNGADTIKRRPSVVDMTDFAIIEECEKYNECGVYRHFIDSNKAAYKIEYNRTVHCDEPGFFGLSYASYDVDYRNIRDYCPRSSSGVADKKIVSTAYLLLMTCIATCIIFLVV